MNHKFPILVVEDEPLTRKLLENQLKEKGYEVTTAENGIKALELFENNFYPIVISDWMMPGLDGVELCRAIRKIETDGYVFIILLTSKTSKADIVAGLEAGADDYLSKPFDPAELMARIATCIRVLNLERSLKAANEEIRHLSITDPLTGCFNRSYLNEQFPREIARARRYGHPLSILLCDIDHFKKVNDTYGHQAGDHVLKHFSKCLSDATRDSVDWLVRYGGEEFLIVLPETSLTGAGSVAERLRQVTEDQTIRYNDLRLSITASFGGSCFFPENKELNGDMEEMIQTADELLYKAKESGRNCVCI